jgi:predicted RNase H-like HicB family nuclease/predicted RNA binding protein YcfA (HicA-like mRNA interferase family)
MKIRDLIKILEEDGWRQVRMRGSHRQYRHASKGGTITVVGKANIDIPPGTLASHFKTGRPEVGGGRIMKYMVVVEKGDTSYGAHVPDLPGCIAVGQSREEVLGLIREAIELHIEGLKEAGEPVPMPSSVSEYVSVDAA